MNAREQTCPYCNALVPLPAEARLGDLLTCPRCEERFALRNVAAPTASASPETPAPPLPPSVAPRRFSNRAIGLGVLGVMLVMAAIGTIYALQTQSFRRANDHGLRQSRSLKRPRQFDIEDAAKVTAYTPGKTPALALLPPGVDVLAGVHVRYLLQENEGNRLLERELPGFGGTVQSTLLARVENATGIQIPEIDHVVVGARVESLQVVLALRTRRPYVAKRLVEKLGAKAHSQARDEELYLFRTALFPELGSGLLNCLDETTVLFAWNVDQNRDLDVVRPRADSKPNAALVELLEQRVGVGGPVWVAAVLEDKLSGLLKELQTRAGGRAPGLPADGQVWLGVRRGALWMTLDPRVTIQAVARAADVAQRERLEKWLRGQLGDKKEVAIVVRDEWLDLQYRP